MINSQNAKFLHTSETHNRSFISAFSIYITVPLRGEVYHPLSYFFSVYFVHFSYFLQNMFVDLNCLFKIYILFLFIVHILSTQIPFYSIYFIDLSYFLQYIYCPTKVLFIIYILFTEATFFSICCPPTFSFFSIYILFTEVPLCSIHFVQLSYFLQYIFGSLKSLFTAHILSS